MKKEENNVRESIMAQHLAEKGDNVGERLLEQEMQNLGMEKEKPVDREKT